MVTDGIVMNVILLLMEINMAVAIDEVLDDDLQEILEQLEADGTIGVPYPIK